MRSNPLLIEASPTKGYVGHVRFEDGTTVDVDLSYLLDFGGGIEPLHDLDYFHRHLSVEHQPGTKPDRETE